MTQGLFMTEETKRRRAHEALIQKGMSLWSHAAEQYRTLPFKYLYLLGLMRERGVKLKKIPNSKLSDYPVIEFFEILEEDEALTWLTQKDICDLERELEQIDFLLKTSCAYTSMKSWIVDATYRLENKRPSAFSLAR